VRTGRSFAAVTVDRGVTTAVSTTRVVATLDVGAISVREVAVLVACFVSFAVATHSLDGGVRRARPAQRPSPPRLCECRRPSPRLPRWAYAAPANPASANGTTNPTARRATVAATLQRGCAVDASGATTR
jgi:hypothetical protein